MTVLLIFNKPVCLCLRDNNFDQYEVSAFALNDKKASHNMNYWEFGDYLGIGAGAHGKITIPEQSQVIRRQKHANPITI